MTRKVNGKTETSTPTRGRKSYKTAAEKRTPRPGCEVEFEAVKVDARSRLQTVLDWHAYSIEAFGGPRSPGLFSPALLSDLETLAQEAIDTALLLRRLAALSQDKRRAEILASPYQLPPTGGVSKAERQVGSFLRGLTKEESDSVVHAAHNAMADVRKDREANAKSPDGCPKCGEENTVPCRLDGEWRWQSSYRDPFNAPARLCRDCGAVTPNDAKSPSAAATTEGRTVPMTIESREFATLVDGLSPAIRRRVVNQVQSLLAIYRANGVVASPAVRRENELETPRDPDSGADVITLSDHRPVSP